jgi:hypothetical protein
VTSQSVRVAIIRGKEIRDDRRETVIKKKATGKILNDGWVYSGAAEGSDVRPNTA